VGFLDFFLDLLLDAVSPCTLRAFYFPLLVSPTVHLLAILFVDLPRQPVRSIYQASFLQIRTRSFPFPSSVVFSSS